MSSSSVGTGRFSSLSPLNGRFISLKPRRNNRSCPRLRRLSVPQMKCGPRTRPCRWAIWKGRGGHRQARAQGRRGWSSSFAINHLTGPNRAEKKLFLPGRPWTQEMLRELVAIEELWRVSCKCNEEGYNVTILCVLLKILTSSKYHIGRIKYGL